MGRTTRKDIYNHFQKLEPCRREAGTSSGTSEGSEPSGSPVGPTERPHIFTISRHVSKRKPEFDHYIVVGRTFLLLPEKMGRDLTSTSLMAYLKYSFDNEEGFPTSYPSSTMEVHTISLTLDNMKVVTTYLTNGILGRNLCSLNSSGKLQHLKSFTFFGFNLNTISVTC